MKNLSIKNVNIRKEYVKDNVSYNETLIQYFENDLLIKETSIISKDYYLLNNNQNNNTHINANSTHTNSNSRKQYVKDNVSYDETLIQNYKNNILITETITIRKDYSLFNKQLSDNVKNDELHSQNEGKLPSKDMDLKISSENNVDTLYKNKVNKLVDQLISVLKSF